MARKALPIPLFLACLWIVFSVQISGGFSCSDWCVASDEAPDNVVQKALDWVCLYSTSACKRIQAGKPCYKPNELRAVASVAFNDYWQLAKSVGTTCDKLFGATNLVNVDPSRENCPMTCL